MNIPTEIFREYDVRGIAERDLSVELARHLGAAVGSYVRRGLQAGGAGSGGVPRVVVGRDCRTSGEPLASALLDGLASTGCRATDIGLVPTPVQYWAIQRLAADGGVQITGSHNPPEYNGFKITLLGRSLCGPEIQSLRHCIETEDYERGTGSIDRADVLDAYLEDLASNLRPADRRLKVVVDAGNGTGGLTAVPLYRKLGYDVVPLYCEPDGTFPNHHADPTVEDNLADLRAAVAREGADLGIAFDGDADRIGVIDRDGDVIWGDRLMILLSRAVLAEAPGATIIGEVKCSKTLYDDIATHGGRPVMWRTGHSLIKTKMKEEGAELAGEMSGHIFFKHRYYGFDDAVYAGGRLLEILSAGTGTVLEHLADVPVTVSTPEIRVDCPEQHKFELVSRAVARFKERAANGGFRVLDIDGARVEWPDGWGLVRPSNTQPILVLRFEAQSRARLDEIRQAFDAEIGFLKKGLGI